FDFGDLTRIFVLDTRQYRSNQECGDQLLQPACEGFPDPTRTVLGDEQEAWLFARLGSSPARWNASAQQIVFAPTPLFGELLNYDQWDGYPAARQRVIDFLQSAQVRNPVVLTGDIHASGAGWVPADTVNLTTPVASEFVATGISSIFPSGLGELAKPFFEEFPHIHFFDGLFRGYPRHILTRDEWRVDFRFVSTTAEPTASVTTAASFVV